MDLDLLRAEIKKLKIMAGDAEMAHSREDILRQQVLEEVANGHPEGRMMAEEVLKTSEIKFSRWCA